jgi:hypothetical protein
MLQDRPTTLRLDCQLAKAIPRREFPGGHIRLVLPFGDQAKQACPVRG